ncbi:MAG: hypothetical protein SVK44_09470, partial [Nitrospirota bacterium]|nr:hypothetical protein [Nitrospirota bacterium]
FFFAYLLRMPDDTPFNQRIGGGISLVVVRIKTSASLLPVAPGLQTPSSLANTSFLIAVSSKDYPSK